QRPAALCDRRRGHRRLRRCLRAGRGAASELRLPQRDAVRLHDRADHRGPPGHDHDRRGHRPAVHALRPRDVRDHGPAAAAAGLHRLPPRLRPVRTTDPAAAPAAVPSSPAAAHSGPATQAGRFRPELHGLRGLAILLVVLYHVWFDRVSGGVGVFLFLAAFLLVGTVVRRAGRGQAMRPAAYRARTFKRLVPPTAVVALATLAGVRLLLPPERWMDAITDAIGSVLHVENWVLIRRGVDYYAAEQTGASP